MSSSKTRGVYRVDLSPVHFYVGRTSDAKRRLRDHLGFLKRGNHPNVYMQSVYNQYRQFDWSLICRCESVEESVIAEQALLNSLLDMEGCVNLARTAMAGPGMHTEKTKTLIREKRSRQVCSDETRKKISLSLVGNQRAKGHDYCPSDAIRKTSSEVQKGRTFSEAHRKALSEARRGRAEVTERTRRKLSDSLKVHWELVRLGQADHGKVLINLKGE